MTSNFIKVSEYQQKAVSILDKFGTREALQWFMNRGRSQFVGFDFWNQNYSGAKTQARFLDDLEIFQVVRFEYQEEEYELYHLDEKFVSNEVASYTNGQLWLYHNNEIVLNTEYYVGEHYGSNLKERKVISWKGIYKLESDFVMEGDLKKIKLGKWIENLPKIVEDQEAKLKLKAVKEKQVLDFHMREKIKKIESSLDFGEYD